ncbi:ankyrin repeat domain-containing protein [Roseivirga sp.]|uniref:ankyrin repeat domain-containing protein n=1 Tax=Roseivirga sp. TaxID=1964215 RepID=UPI003B8C1222
MNFKVLKSIKPTLAIALLILGFALQSCGINKEAANEEIKAPRQTLFEAAFLGNLENVKKHIAAGTDLNLRDDFGSTALGIAATFGKTDIAQALIEGGADLEATGADGSTALHTAAFYGRVEIVKALLKKGSNVGAKNSYNGTALESVQVPFEQVKPVYDQIARDLRPLGLKLDYDQLIQGRQEIATLISNHIQ